MRALRAFVQRLVGLFPSRRADREIEAELQSHLDLHTDDNVRAGMAPAEARRAALLALGGVSQTTETYRDRRGLPRLDSLVRDVRYGLRSLARRPAFTAAAVLILALGIGVNSAMFTLVNAVVLRPLPFADADRIMRLWHTPPQDTFAGMTTFPLSPANFLDWSAQSQAFEHTAIYRAGRRVLTGHGTPDAVVALRVSSSFLPILSLTPVHGRGFTTQDDMSGGPAVVMLSEGFFRSRFGGDLGIIGRTIDLNRVPHEVIGIVPDAPSFIERAQVWLPLAWTSEDRAVRNNHNYHAIAKLKPGVTVTQAQSQLDAIATRLAAEYPADNKDWGALVLPLQQDLVGDARRALLLLLGAVGLVLLIACANLANLMLVHTQERAAELAVRTALGASRARIVQQLLTEGMLLGLIGGAAGLVVAHYGLQAITAALGSALPRAGEVQIDARVLAFTAIVAVATGLLAAFAPAWRLTGRRTSDALKKADSRGHSSSGQGRVRSALVISEVALALMLLVGAGLLLRSVSSLRHVDPGFDSRNILTAEVQIPEAKYSTPQHRNQFFADVLERVTALPGAESAAWIDDLPFTGGSTQYVHPEGTAAVRETDLPVVAVRLLWPGYLGTVRMRLLEGRDFTAADDFGAKRVVIVSERTARRFWPGQRAIGKHVTMSMTTKEPAEVVGVVAEVKLDGLDTSEEKSESALYAPARQFAYDGWTLVVRTTVEPESLGRAVTDAVHALDPEQPVLNVVTMDSIVEESLGERPFAAWLLAAFAALAMVLATVGIYSVIAYGVRQRVREIGIRLALGAQPSQVIRVVVIEGLKPTIIGVIVGLVLTVLLTGVLRSLLFGVSQYDPTTLIGVSTLMILVGLLAAIIPAYRATRFDVVRTLRAE